MPSTLRDVAQALACALPQGKITRTEEFWCEVSGENNLCVRINANGDKFHSSAQFPRDLRGDLVRHHEDYRTDPPSCNTSKEKDAPMIVKDIMRRVVLPFLPMLERSNVVLADWNAHHNAQRKAAEAYQAAGYQVRDIDTSPHAYGPGSTRVKISSATASADINCTHEQMMRILAILAETK